jgi:hypothetical protein
MVPIALHPDLVAQLPVRTGWRELMQVFRSRPHRVGLLLLAITIMAGADLALTLNYITSIGMVELNPVARAVMSLGSTTAVVIWKVALTAFTVGVLFGLRRRAIAEVATWACATVMVLLSMHWLNFINEVQTMGSEYLVLALEAPHEGWTVMD